MTFKIRQKKSLNDELQIRIISGGCISPNTLKVGPCDEFEYYQCNTHSPRILFLSFSTTHIILSL